MKTRGKIVVAVSTRLQSMADGGPVSLLDMPDTPQPEDMPGQEKDSARSEYTIP